MFVDLFIVVSFLVLTLVVGLGHGRQVTNIREYALGGRNFSTGALVATIVATWASGSGFFVTLSKTYSDGFFYMFASLGIGTSLIITALVLAPRMGEFLGKVSIAEAMGDLYGKPVRILTAIAGTIGVIGSIAVQFKIFGNVFAYFVNLPGYVSIIIAGFIATLYSAFGGIRAVTFTDVLQFFAFGMIIPLIGFLVWSDFYHEGLTLSGILADPKFDVSALFNFQNQKLIGLIVMFCYFSLPDFTATAFQRVAIGTDVTQVKKAFFISGISLIIIKLMIAWIPLMLSGINSSLQANQILYHIVDHYSFTGLKGLVIVAIIAFAMSTADSKINSASVLFTNDICKLLIPEIRKEIVISRIYSMFIGIGAVLLSLIENDLLEIIILANSFYSPVVTPILLLTIFGFRSTGKSVFISMLAGFGFTIMWKFLPIEFAHVSTKIVGVFLAMLCNVIFLFGSHYLLKQPGGWVGIKDQKSFDEERKKINLKLDAIIRPIKNFSFSKFINSFPLRDDATYVTLGIYFAVYTLTTMYVSYSGIVQHSYIIMSIYQAMLITSTLTAMYPIWPLSIKQHIREKIIRIWWPISIFYMFIVFNSFFVMMHKLEMLQCAMFATNLIIAALIFGWRASLVLMSVGIFLGVSLYEYTFSQTFNMSLGSPEFMLIYMVLFLGTAVIIFLKPKQEQQERSDTKIKYLKKEIDFTQRELANIGQGIDFLQDQLKNKEGVLNKKTTYLRNQLRIKNEEISRLINMKDNFLRNITHESNTPMTGIISLCDILYSYYDQLDSKKVKSTIKDIINSGDRLQSYVNSIVDLSKISSNSYELTKEDIDLGALAKERTILYKKIFSDEVENQKFIFDIKGNFIVNCDRYYITQTIDNLISNAVKYGNGNPVTISLKKGEDNSVSVSITDRGIGIPKTEILSIFNKFVVGSRTSTPAGGRGVGLALCQSVIEAHEGSISAISDDKITKFTFTLPNKV